MADEDMAALLGVTGLEGLSPVPRTSASHSPSPVLQVVEYP
jgi:hypothetical protein